MAQRRMFSKSITNSSMFLMMPQSSQNLYFHLGMNADDDGFCEHFTIMRMTESKPDDLKILHTKGFVEVFDERVLIILQWKENNYLRADRYTPSKYLEVYKEEVKRLAVGIPKVDTGKVSIGKVSKGKETYGEFNHVKLSKIEKDKLSIKLNVNEYIDRLDGYIEQIGRDKYKSHYATILNWYRKDLKANPPKKSVYEVLSND
jgi:hypothetical protein